MKRTNLTLVILIFFATHLFSVREAFAVSLAYSICESEDSLHTDSINVMAYYAANHDTLLPSKSVGTVSEGELVNGRIIPFYGENFQYFSAESYLGGRAFAHEKVINTLLLFYADLKSNYPERFFYIMEMSNKQGGKIYPHRTHQNGLSVDLMLPKIKNGQPDYSLDSLGKNHYFLSFNDHGEFAGDSSLTIDFELLAHQLLLLDFCAKKSGLKIAKVIIKLEYKDELFTTSFGEQLKNTDIYFAQKLTPLINDLHDDHVHVDFEEKD
ncbi:MAG: penicillin-insensitive murein endopeptidase [Crocinitomicaceae bacterium]|nr:penicillin-insensitive murein endopeptidase [Crocinitomicaceae bacterium]